MEQTHGGHDLATALPGDQPGVRWSVMVRNATTGDVLAQRDADTVLRTASIGKVFLLMEAARALEAGEADPLERLSWRDDELVGDSGLWHRMVTRTLPLVDLCMLTASVSDNLATNVLVRRFGLDAVARTAAACGATASGLLDRIRNERGPDVPWTTSVGNARELSDVMARLFRDEVCSPAVSARVRDWLTGNVEVSGVPGALPLDGLAHSAADEPVVSLFNKTGSISVVQADVGVLSGPGGALAYACLAEWEDRPDPTERVRSGVRAAMARLGAALGDLVTADPRA